jgi:hypothetical protein
VRNHADAMLACDFFVSITAGFRTLYVFVVPDVGTRRIASLLFRCDELVEWRFSVQMACSAIERAVR